MWPWRRDRRRAADPGTPASGPTAAPPDLRPADWRRVEPLQCITAEHPLVNPVERFRASLGSWQDPRLLSPLGHAVGAGEPFGLIDVSASPPVNATDRARGRLPGQGGPEPGAPDGLDPGGLDPGGPGPDGAGPAAGPAVVSRTLAALTGIVQRVVDPGRAVRPAAGSPQPAPTAAGSPPASGVADARPIARLADPAGSRSPDPSDRRGPQRAPAGPVGAPGTPQPVVPDPAGQAPGAVPDPVAQRSAQDDPGSGYGAATGLGEQVRTDVPVTGSMTGLLAFSGIGPAIGGSASGPASGGGPAGGTADAAGITADGPAAATAAVAARAAPAPNRPGAGRFPASVQRSGGTGDSSVRPDFSAAVRPVPYPPGSASSAAAPAPPNAGQGGSTPRRLGLGAPIVPGTPPADLPPARPGPPGVAVASGGSSGAELGSTVQRTAASSSDPTASQDIASPRNLPVVPGPAGSVPSQPSTAVPPPSSAGPPQSAEPLTGRPLTVARLVADRPLSLASQPASGAAVAGAALDPLPGSSVAEPPADPRLAVPRPVQPSLTTGTGIAYAVGAGRPTGLQRIMSAGVQQRAGSAGLAPWLPSPGSASPVTPRYPPPAPPQPELPVVQPILAGHPATPATPVPQVPPLIAAEVTAVPGSYQVTVQRQAEPTAPAGDGPAPAAGPSGGPAGGSEPEELLAQLYDPLLRRLKADLRVDRDRCGSLTDLRY